MKVHIGKPPSGYSLYGWLREFFGETVADYIFNRWAEKPLYMKIETFVCNLLNRQRKVFVRIDPWDSWSADYTLAVVILPVLQSVRKEKQGVPAQFLPNSWEYSEEEFSAAQKQWEDVLDKMILAFHNVLEDEIMYGTEQQERVAKEIEEGLRLFAKHYRSLWT